MSADSRSYRLEIGADARLAAGVGGLARFLGEAAGLSSDAAVELQKSVIAACIAASENLGEDAQLSVTFAVYTDRLEVAIAHQGSADPAVGLDRIAGSAETLGGIDRMEYETKGGAAVTRLTKYLGPVPRMA